MNKPCLIAVALVLICLAAATIAVHAGQSTNYHLDWFTPLTSGGGGPASSANYAVNITLGQTVSKASASTNYPASLGYWAGVPPNFPVHLPFIAR